MDVICLLIGLAIGAGVGFWVGCSIKSRKKTGQDINEINERRAEEKEIAKERILELMAGKREISNDEVEKVLGVSDTTATNYLQELEKEGKLEQIGQEGRFVRYQLRT